MSLGFMSGFATGLGQGLEKFNEDELKRKQMLRDSIKTDLEIQKLKNSKHKNWKNGFEKEMNTIQKEQLGLKSSSNKMKPKERRDAYNANIDKALGVINEYGVKAGEEGFVDFGDIFAKYENAGLLEKVVDHKGWTITESLSEQIKNRDADITEQGTVITAKMTQNSKGQMVPELDEAGSKVYEASGATASKTTEFFNIDTDTVEDRERVFLTKGDEQVYPLKSEVSEYLREGWKKLYKPSEQQSKEKFIDSFIEENLGQYEGNKNKARLAANKAYANLGKTALQKELTEADKMVGLANSYSMKNYGENILNLDYSRVDHKGKEEFTAMARTGIKLVLGKSKGTEMIEKVNKIASRTDSLILAGDGILQDIQDGKDVNVVKQAVMDYYSVYFGYTKEEADRAARNKTISAISNEIRHSLFGSVLTKGENKSYLEQSSSLYRNSQDMFLNVKRYIKSSITELEGIEDSIGKELFKMQFGDELNSAKNKLKILEDVEVASSRESKKKTLLEEARQSLKPTDGIETKARALVRKFKPDWTDDQITTYLDNLRAKKRRGNK